MVGNGHVDVKIEPRALKVRNQMLWLHLGSVGKGQNSPLKEGNGRMPVNSTFCARAAKQLKVPIERLIGGV